MAARLHNQDLAHIYVFYPGAPGIMNSRNEGVGTWRQDCHAGYSRFWLVECGRAPTFCSVPFEIL